MPGALIPQFLNLAQFDFATLRVDTPAGNIFVGNLTSLTPVSSGPGGSSSLPLMPAPGNPGCEAVPGDCHGFSVPFAPGGLGDVDPIFIDPIVAIGYDYAIDTLLAPDVFFDSVLIPEQTGFGSGDLLDLLVGPDLFSLVVGTEFFFTADDVTNFIVGVQPQGINPLLGLDPSDPTVFVTGLTFDGAGTASLTGDIPVTMIPITENIQAAPEPQTLALILGPLLLYATTRRRRAHQS